MEPDPPCFLVINGDQLIYCQGRIAWYMQIGAQMYWVTNPGEYLKLPTPETLVLIRQYDRQRLEAYLRMQQRDEWTHNVRGHVNTVGTPDAPPAPPAPPPKPLGTDYKELAEDIDLQAEEIAAEELNRRIWAKQRTKEHNALMEAVAQRIADRWHQRAIAGAIFALARIDDHDYIEAMFALYSQGRRRLL